MILGKKISTQEIVTSIVAKMNFVRASIKSLMVDKQSTSDFFAYEVIKKFLTI